MANRTSFIYYKAAHLVSPIVKWYLKIRLVSSAIVSIMLLTCITIHSSAQITSRFDTDADGWTFANAIVHNPAGYLTSTYSANATSSTQYWIAPAKFRGNHVARSVGMNLTFDLQQSAAGTSNISTGDVRIESPNVILVYSLPVKPAVAPDWTNYSIRLDETAGWRISSTAGAVATRMQVITAITNITAIEIHASYITQNPYTASIDNVVMEERTLLASPLVTSFIPKAGEVGSTVTISGANFSANPAENVVYFGSTQASISSATASQLVVTVPAGAAFAPITAINKNTGLSVQSQFQFTPTFSDGGRLIRASFDSKSDITLTSSPGNEPKGISLSDIDGDGWTDIVVAEGTNTVSIFRNLGAGGDLTSASFAPPVVLTGAGNGSGLRINDLDGDGNADIACEYTSGSLTHFSTYRNTSSPGSITFEAAEHWNGLVYSGFLSNVVDVDGDGRMDLIGQHGSGSVFVDFWIAQNISAPGNIEFGASLSYFGSATLDAGAGVGTGDLDNDGRPEMIVEHGFGNQFQIIKNNSTPGTISFGTPFVINESVTGGVQVYDINEDGNLDLVWKKGGTEDITVRLNTNSDGILDANDFTTEVRFLSELGNYGGMTFSDLNGDGKVDILATDHGYMSVYENVFTDGTFNSSAFVEAYLHQGAGGSTYPEYVHAADLNGDGRPDVVMGITNVSPPRISLYENRNSHRPAISINTVSPLKGQPGSEVTITGDHFSPVPSENLVRFGSLKASVQSATATELVVIVPTGVTSGMVSVTRDGLSSQYHLPFISIFSSGIDFDASHFAPPISFALTGADYDVEVADLNNDGKADVVAEGTGGRGYSFLNTHISGAISTLSLVPDDTTSTSAQNVRLMDFDDDGLTDITSSSGGFYRNISTSTELAFQPSVSFSTGANHGFADFNHDGKTDMTGTSGTNVIVTENRTTTGTFTTGTPIQSFQGYNYSKAATGGGTATGDFDNDGLMDFAATNPGADNLTVWRNNGSYRISTTQFTAMPNIATGDNPGRLYASDLDLDGKLDLVLYYSVTTSSQFVSVLHNQSTTGNIAFTRTDIALGASGTTAAVNDLDGDGRPEIIVVSEAANRFSIFKNNSSPGVINASSFAAPFHTAVTTPRGVTSGDMNGDGKPELFITRAAGLLLVYENMIPHAALTISTQPENTAFCNGNDAVLSIAATGTSGITYQWQKFDSGVDGYVNLTNGADYAGVNTETLTVIGATSSDAGIFRALVSGDNVSTLVSDIAELTSVNLPGAPSASPVSICPGTPANLTASGGADGSYRWYTEAVGETAVAGAFGSDYTTPPINSATHYFVSINNGACESTRTSITISVHNAPAKPTIQFSATPGFCEGSSKVLSAPAGYSYAWSNGELTREISVSIEGTYSVTLTDNNSCVSETSDPVTIAENPNPAIPVISSSNGNIVCVNESLTLSAPAGYSYEWSTSATTREITVAAEGDYFVEVTDNNGCSAVSVIFTVEVGLCNHPPVISSAQVETVVGGTVTVDLMGLLSDPDNNLDINSLAIHEMPLSGADAAIDGNGTLHVSYNGVAFSGTDRLIVQICDTQGQCVQQALLINVVGSIVIYNGVSPNGDGKNDFWLIEFIDLLDNTKNNEVRIFNRWGDLIWEAKNYDNQTVVFTGLNKNGKELPSGNYFYQVNFSERSSESGYISLRR